LPLAAKPVRCARSTRLTKDSGQTGFRFVRFFILNGTLKTEKPGIIKVIVTFPN
jgi:hypothetical protein